MLSDDFDQTVDTVYEVWNYNDDGGPLVGVFDDEAKADAFELDQIIETGGGLVIYYPPIERYVDLPPAKRARTLLSEAIIRLEGAAAEIDYHFPIPVTPLRLLDDFLPDHDLELQYDRSKFRFVIDEVPRTQAGWELVRGYRTVARVRHLSVYDRDVLLSVEEDLRFAFARWNKRAREE